MSNLSFDTHSLDALRHEAKRLQRAYEQNGFASWPQLKLAAQTQGLDRATALQRLKIALARGNAPLAQALLRQWPDLADGLFGLQCALYRRDAVAQALAEDPGLATRQAGPRSPIVHLAFSKWIHLHPELHDDMMAIAGLLLAHGADVNDSTPVSPDNSHRLSALYGALGHANNMPLAQWLLDQGADPARCSQGATAYSYARVFGHSALSQVIEARGQAHPLSDIEQALAQAATGHARRHCPLI